MSAMGTWDLAHPIVANHFRGIIEPIFFGNAPTVLQQNQMRGKPRPYLLSAIDLLKRIQGKTIVEVGCMRQPMAHGMDQFNPACCNDGHSTIFWGHGGLDVHSVDINPGAVKIAAAECAKYPNVKVTCADGIEFLKAFGGTIDLLYLDAWDVIKGTPYAEKHLEAFEVAREKLSPASIVLIDDTDVQFGGKGRMVVPAVIRAGYDLLLCGRQTMLMRL